MEKKHFKSVYIAGFGYYEGAEVFSQLDIGTALELKAEPENRYDEYAVTLYYQEYKLGFVPKECNEEISKLLTMGHNVFTATIQQIDSREHPSHQVQVGIYIVKKM